MSEPPKDLDDLFEDLMCLKNISTKIKRLNFTRKTTGGKYPLNVGYSNQVRRPLREILNWMNEIEELLENVLERFIEESN